MSLVDSALVSTSVANGELPVLICTDFMSRGIDFKEVDHVVQFDFASNVVEFLHRIGRTARAGRSGKGEAGDSVYT